ncbi:MAG TPA: hypothetical protein VKB34_05145 [Povalibacter sp.]|nr:hypothetical protein [Povalibacter sp.]
MMETTWNGSAAQGRRQLLSSVTLGALLMAVGFAAVRPLSPEYREVAAPLLVMVGIATAFWYALYLRDGRPPAFEIGSFCMVGTFAYAALPLLWFMLGGLEFTVLSARRLYKLDPTVTEFTAIGWMHVVYMAALACAYLGFRTRRPAPTLTTMRVSKQQITALVLMLILLNLFFIAVRFLYGVNFAATYDDALTKAYAAYRDLPLVVQQVIARALQIRIIVNCCVMVFLVRYWRRPGCRLAIILWLAYATVDYFLNPGGRFTLLALFVALLLAYARFVGTPRLSRLALGLGLLFVAFIGAGFLRGGASLFEGVQSFDVLEGASTFFTVSNEFQISYASALELDHMIRTGQIDTVPWQVYLSELQLLVPQQFLPFEKIDPVEWALFVTNDDDYFNFGAIAQSVLGLGWVELILRGGIVGAAFALVHNWWAQKPAEFWRNCLYVWLAIVSYNSIRNQSLFLLTWVVTSFVPVVLVVTVLSRMLARVPRQPPDGRPLPAECDA